ncbi:MAG: serine/threonine protein kinase, partial [Myxococcales bacterium]|nr:serine/threonine protein kinase [Myxococcales bacterium]
MLDSWARAYAERWGLPHPAQAELQRVIDGVQAGLVADSQSETRPIAVGDVLDSSPTTPHRMPFGSMSPTSDRYEDQGLIKQGGMGEVRRVWDRALNRTVAMKLLRTDLLDREDLTLRFMEEAQATGQLEHPGIVPIYDIGTLEDGRPYFTMKEIRGRTLLDVIEELHIASDTGWKPSPTGWTFAKVVGVYHSVCKAVAYAHSRGVLHRDLKPTNVMVGAFGEVVVMDWGLAKIGRNGETVEVTSEPPSRQVVTTRSRANLYQTQTGSIAGTPNYMAPEQALGEAERVTQRSDVYSLGALLYEILADRAPYLGEDPQEVVAELLSGPPPSPYPPFQRPGQASAEEGLREICNRAMSREADDRYADAGALADAVSDWIDDASARERAIRLVEQADEVGPELISLRKRAATLRSRATSALAELPVTATVADKRSAWALEDQAAELDRELSRQQGRYVDLLHAALDSVPGLPQARGRLRGLEQLTGRAVAGDEAGSGWLTVVTEQPGVTVEIRRFENINRRLVAVPVEDVPGALVTPVEGLTLPVGSYQLRLRHAGLQPLTVLAKVDRGELWSTAPAGRTKPEPLRMVAPGTDPEGTVRIPRGWSWFGGDRETDDSFPRTRAWVPGFLIARH